MARASPAASASVAGICASLAREAGGNALLDAGTRIESRRRLRSGTYANRKPSVSPDGCQGEEDPC